MDESCSSSQLLRVIQSTASFRWPIRSVTLGVFPLVCVACKSYAAVYEKLSTFSHYSRRVVHLQKQLKVQRRIFENEVYSLLLSAINNDATMVLMRKDPGHGNWADNPIDQEPTPIGRELSALSRHHPRYRGGAGQASRATRCFRRAHQAPAGGKVLLRGTQSHD